MVIPHRAKGKRMIKKKKRCLTPILLVAFLLAGCGSNETDVYLSKVPEGMQYVYGLKSSAFCIPSEYADFIDVKTPDDMLNLNAGYHLETDKADAYVTRDYGIYGECFLDGTYADVEKLQDAIELASNIRLSDISSVSYYHDSYRDMSKGIYTCHMEALYNTTYFSDFDGYLALIAKDSKTMVYYAGTKGEVSKNEMLAAKSLVYNEYAFHTNKGQTDKPKRDLSAEEGSIGDYVKTEVYYRGQTTEKVAMGLKLDRLEKADPQEVDLSETPLNGKRLPELDSDHEYVRAVFDIDSQGYDISEDVPDFRIRLCEPSGDDLKDNPYTYCLNTENGKITLLCVVQREKTVNFAVGLNHAVITGGTIKK